MKRTHMLVRWVVLLTVALPLTYATPVQAQTACTGTVDVPAVSSSGFQLLGSWSTAGLPTPQAMFGTLAMTSQNAARISYTTSCPISRVTIFNSQGPDRGSYEIKINGLSKGSHNLYTPEYRRQAGRTFEVSLGYSTTIEIIAVLQANQKLDVDALAFDIAYAQGSTVNDDNLSTGSFLRKVGDWGTVNDAKAIGGSYIISTTPMDLVRLAFKGNPSAELSRLRPFFSRHFYRGRVAVTVDGYDMGTINQQGGSGLEYRNNEYYWLGHNNSDVHIITISVLPALPNQPQHPVEIDAIDTENCPSTGCRGYAIFQSNPNDNSYSTIGTRISFPTNSIQPSNQQIFDGGLTAGVLWAGGASSSWVEVGWKRSVSIVENNGVPHIYWQHYQPDGGLAPETPGQERKIADPLPFDVNAQIELQIKRRTGSNSTVSTCNGFSGLFYWWDVYVNQVLRRSACLEYQYGGVSIGGESSLYNTSRNNMNTRFNTPYWAILNNSPTSMSVNAYQLQNYNDFGYCKSINAASITGIISYFDARRSCGGT
jgi:hypothetical protein